MGKYPGILCLIPEGVVLTHPLTDIFDNRETNRMESNELPMKEEVSVVKGVSTVLDKEVMIKQFNRGIKRKRNIVSQGRQMFPCNQCAKKFG